MQNTNKSIAVAVITLIGLITVLAPAASAATMSTTPKVVPLSAEAMIPSQKMMAKMSQADYTAWMNKAKSMVATGKKMVASGKKKEGNAMVTGAMKMETVVTAGWQKRKAVIAATKK